MSEKFLTANERELLASHSLLVDHFVLIIQLLYQDSKERAVGIRGIDYLLKTVDGSIYNLSAWLEGIFVFDRWLKSQNRKTDFRKMLGYLQCCEESPEVKDTRLTFPDLVQAMLDEHGYIG